MRGESSAPDGSDAQMLDAVLADETVPYHVAVRAMIAGVGETNERLARMTAMRREFVAGIRRRAAAGGARAVLQEPPTAVERVLDAATAHIVAAGRPQIAIGDVVAAVGIPRRTLYRSYARDGLVDACQRRATTLWRARFVRRIETAETTDAERVFVVLDAIADWVGSSRFADDQLLQVPAAADARGDDLREHVSIIERFAAGVAERAQSEASRAFGIYVATSVLGAAACLGRRDEAHAAAVATVERLTGLTR
jgi:AcrR family transcriptional regulator